MQQTMHLVGKRPKQSIRAASDCSSSSSRLIIVDKHSKIRFLVDTGSDLCCFPRRLLPNCSPVNYELSAANGSKIRTYGFLTRSLDLGLRRNFLWRFVVADVDVPIIGSDFLAHYHLIPDCRTKHIIDVSTGIQAPGLPQYLSQSSIKTIQDSSSYSSLLSEFPEVTHPPGLPRDIKHETIHHIRTTPGPPVTSKARRLCPEKLKIARKEFDDMLKAGTT